MKLLLLWISFGYLALADFEVLVSSNSKLKHVSAKEIADLFLGKTTKIQGYRVIPLDNKKCYRDFYKKVVHKNTKQLRDYWIREMYKGNRVPPRKLSEQQIKLLMKKNNNYITYSYSSKGKTVFKIH